MSFRNSRFKKRSSYYCGKQFWMFYQKGQL